MSEYQYYEFQAIDRALGETDRETLRALSTRARITATTFVNTYHFGDFRGDPEKLMERWFDLHLYFANWGSRRLMIRWPARMIDRLRLSDFLSEVDGAALRSAGGNVILDMTRDEVEAEENDEGEGLLAALAPLRADVMAGDLRLFYLLWLTAVEEDTFEADAVEPMTGIGPLTGPLEAFAEFFAIDPDLVAAAAERSSGLATSQQAASRALALMPDSEKTEWLRRLFDADPLVGAELRAWVREHEGAAAPSGLMRTVGELRARAEELRLAGERAEAEREAAELARQANEALSLRRTRLDAIVKRGAGAWREVEAEIERRNAAGYENATRLLSDLQEIAQESGATQDFQDRLRAIRERHQGKRTLIERLASLG